MSGSTVSVVISCFELGRTLPEAIRSALAQRRPVAEVVVVDDGSTDAATVAVLDSLDFPRTRIVRTTHLGVAAARNLGVAESTAPYVVLLDADDCLDDSFVERLAKRLDDDPRLSFVSCGVQAFEGAHYVWVPPTVEAARTLTRGSVHISSMFRRNLWSAVGGFDPSLDGYEDLDFWLRALRLGFQGEIIPEPLLRYRVRCDSRYRRALEPGRYVRTMRTIIERHRELLDERGTEILLDKQAFLVDLRAHRDHLLAERARICQSTPPPRTRTGDQVEVRVERAVHQGLVLAYHRIATLTPDTHRLCVSPEHFQAQLRYLKATCTVMRLEDLVHGGLAGTLPPRAVALTFDDGYRDALLEAAPLLEASGLPGMFFVNSERLSELHEAWHDEVEAIFFSPSALPDLLKVTAIDGTHLLTHRVHDRRAALMAVHAIMMPATAGLRRHIVDQLREWSGIHSTVRIERRLLTGDEVSLLAQTPGCEVGSHSAHHLMLTNHDRDVQTAELEVAKRALEAAAGRSITALAYPFGDHDAAVRNTARETAHDVAVTVDPGLVGISTDPMCVPRFEAPDVTGLSFEAFINDAFRTGARPETPQQNRDLARQEQVSGQAELRCRPSFLIVDPTSRCNARCVMCHVSFRPSNDHGVDLTDSLFKDLLPLAQTAAHINLFASGEPTVAPNLERMIAAIRQKLGKDAVLWISTNGKKLPETVVDLLTAPGLGLQFSVDGGTREVFERIRRGIRFEDLCRSLELVQRRKGSGPYPRTAFSSTISKRNVADLANIFELAKRFGIEHIHFYEEDPEVPEEEAFLLDETDRPIFERQVDAINGTGVSYSNELFFRGRRGLLATEPPPPEDRPTLICKAPWHVFHARADGTVRTCCTLRRSMGDLQRQSVEEVWNGPEYVALRRAFLTQSAIPGTCYRCVDPLRTHE